MLMLDEGSNPSREDMGEFVFDCVEYSERGLRDFADLATELIGNRELMGPTANVTALRQSAPFAPLSYLRPGQPILRDIESYATWMIFTSNLYMRTVGDDEFVRVSGGDGDDLAVQTQHAAIRRAFTLPGHAHQYWDALGNAATLGVGYIVDPVVEKNEMIFGMGMRDAGGGIQMPDFQLRNLKYKDIKWESIHPLDMYCDWSRPLGVQMHWAVIYRRMPAMEFKAWIKSLDPDGVDEAALERALTKNNKNSMVRDKSTLRWQELAIRGITEEDLHMPESYRPVGFWEFRGIVPWEPVDSLERYRLIVVANNEVPFQGPHPYYPHNVRAIRLAPMPGRVFPMSPLEVGRYQQDELDTWRNLRTRAGIKTVNAPTLVDKGVWDDAAQFAEPSSDQVIMGNGAGLPGGLGAAAQQMQFNYAWLFSSSQLLNEDRQWFREGTGLLDIIRGVAAGSRTTRREIEELSAQGNLPMNATVDLIENEDLPAIARDVGPRMILALRDEIRDGYPVGSMMLKEMLGLETAEMEHLLYDFSIRFQGSARFNARGNLAGVMNMVTNIIAMNPGIASFINIPKLAVDLMSVASPDAAQKYLLSPQSAMGQALVAQAMNPGAQQRGVPSPPAMRGEAGANP